VRKREGSCQSSGGKAAPKRRGKLKDVRKKASETASMPTIKREVWKGSSRQPTHIVRRWPRGLEENKSTRPVTSLSVNHLKVLTSPRNARGERKEPTSHKDHEAILLEITAKGPGERVIEPEGSYTRRLEGVISLEKEGPRYFDRKTPDLRALLHIVDGRSIKSLANEKLNKEKRKTR